MSGAEAEDVSESLKELNLRLSEANSLGTGPLQEAFDMLGLSAREFQDMDPSVAFRKIAGELEGFDAADRGFLADAIFGGDANYILKLLDKGEEGIAALEAEASRLGATFSQDQVDAADKANAAMTRLWTVLEGTAGSMTATMAPAIESFVNIGVAGAEWLAAKFVSWKDTLTTVFATVEFLVTNFGSVWDVAVKSTSYKLASIYEGVKHYFLSVIPETFAAAGNLWLDNFNTITSSIGDLFGELWDWIASGGQNAIEFSVSDVIGDLQSNIDEAVTRISDSTVRVEAGYETLLREDMEKASAALGEGLQKHISERLGKGVKEAVPDVEREFKQLTDPAAKAAEKKSKESESESKKEAGTSSRDGAVVAQRGSVEAVSAIIAASRGQGSPEEKQVEHLQEAVKLLRDIAKAGAPVIEALRLS